jgi:hypothetical protein
VIASSLVEQEAPYGESEAMYETEEDFVKQASNNVQEKEARTG